MMDIDGMLARTQRLYEPVDVALYVLNVALETTVHDAEERQVLVEGLQAAIDGLDKDDRLALGHVLEQRLHQLTGAGAYSGRVPLLRRLTIVESHIVHDALIDGGIDARIRREHVSAADVLHPTTGAEIWVRPGQLSAARALIERLEAADGPQRICGACGEENPGHFRQCWNCNHRLDLSDAAGESSRVDELIAEE
ncbi:MAG: hypothetical protein VX589_03240 [Myxococcota bacterium]|nr:hypothetical protein [Myxococcota bacterium]